ncbi:hypothetical protein KCU91_g98, partial [Aureobasidium melanogenum]
MAVETKMDVTVGLDEVDEGGLVNAAGFENGRGSFSLERGGSAAVKEGGSLVMNASARVAGSVTSLHHQLAAASPFRTLDVSCLPCELCRLLIQSLCRLRHSERYW